MRQFYKGTPEDRQMNYPLTEQFGLVKPIVTTETGHYTALNLDAIDNIFAEMRDRIVALEQKIVALERLHAEPESGHNV